MILLDAVFGPKWYRTEIVWERTNARGTPKNWPHLHDVIFHYATGNSSHRIPKVKADEAKMPHTLITGPDGMKYQTYELTGAGITKEEKAESRGAALLMGVVPFECAGSLVRRDDPQFSPPPQAPPPAAAKHACY